MIWFIISLFAIAIDQASKWYISSHFALGQSVPVILNVFHLTYCKNTGAAFSILKDNRWFLTFFSLAIILLLLYFLIKNKPNDKLVLLSASFIIGGAVGNLIDRILWGAVTDFLDFCLINFAIFNVADCFVVVGTILFAWYLLKSKGEKNGEN